MPYGINREEKISWTINITERKESAGKEEINAIFPLHCFVKLEIRRSPCWPRVDLCFVFGDAERRKGTSSSQGQADKWQRFKRHNRRRARIFHRREKGGALAALSNCIPTFGEGKGRHGQRRVENERTWKAGIPKKSKLQNQLSDFVRNIGKIANLIFWRNRIFTIAQRLTRLGL